MRQNLVVGNWQSHQQLLLKSFAVWAFLVLVLNNDNLDAAERRKLFQFATLERTSV